MVSIKKKDQLRLAFEGKEKEPPEVPNRSYLGFSGFGHKCARRVWYGFRFTSKPEPIEPRVERIFERGHWEEHRVIKTLNDSGCKAFKLVNGKQIELTGHEKVEEQEEIVGYRGHAKGHPDGRVIGVPLHDPEEVMLLEIKTASQKSFKQYQNVGLKKFNLAYFSQIQMSMGELGLKRTLYIVCNKNDESRDYDVIEFDSSFYSDLKRKEEYLIDSKRPPQKAFPKGHFKCDYCPHVLVCHHNVAPRITCRSCDHVAFENDGVVKCNLHSKKLSTKMQIKACDKYKRAY